MTHIRAIQPQVKFIFKLQPKIFRYKFFFLHRKRRLLLYVKNVKYLRFDKFSVSDEVWIECVSCFINELCSTWIINNRVSNNCILHTTLTLFAGAFRHASFCCLCSSNTRALHHVYRNAYFGRAHTSRPPHVIVYCCCNLVLCIFVNFGCARVTNLHCVSGFQTLDEYECKYLIFKWKSLLMTFTLLFAWKERRMTKKSRVCSFCRSSSQAPRATFAFKIKTRTRLGFDNLLSHYVALWKKP